MSGTIPDAILAEANNVEFDARMAHSSEVAVSIIAQTILSAERRGAEREREIATLDYTWDVICDRLSVKRGSDAFTVISAIEKVKAASIASAIRKGAS